MCATSGNSLWVKLFGRFRKLVGQPLSQHRPWVLTCQSRVDGEVGVVLFGEGQECCW